MCGRILVREKVATDNLFQQPVHRQCTDNARYIYTPTQQYSDTLARTHLANKLIRIRNLLIALSRGQLLGRGWSNARHGRQIRRDDTTDKIHHGGVIDARTLGIVAGGFTLHHKQDE